MAKFAAFKPTAALLRFLDQLPSEVVDSFTQEQLAAIPATLTRRKHPIDIRLSIPYLWRRFYLVVVAGPEQRTADRVRAKRSHYLVWTTRNLLFAIDFLISGLLLSFALFTFKTTALNQLFPKAIYSLDLFRE